MLTPEMNDLITALAAATAVTREPTPGCPEGTSRWHTPARLLDEGHLAGLTTTDIHRVGAALQRRGLVTRKTQFGVTRWALTGTGTGLAAHLARVATP